MAQFLYPPIAVSTAGAATEAKQDTIISELQDVNTELDSQSTLLTSLDGKDFATETTLASILADTTSLDAKDFSTETTLAAQKALLESRLAGSLVPESFDYQSFTYVTSGNGIGEIETVTYRTGGAGGSVVATLTFTYDANDNVATVTRS